MPSPDPKVRSLASRVAAYSRVAGGPPRGAAPDASIPDELRDGYHVEVDPEGALPLRLRQRKAAAAFKRDQAADALRRYRDGQGSFSDDDGGAAA